MVTIEWYTHEKELYERTRSGNCTSIRKITPVGGTIFLRDENIVNNYILIDKSISNVFKFLESHKNRIDTISMGNVVRSYRIKVQSLLMSEGVIFVKDGILYSTEKAKTIKH
jgi:hypothetical protein